MYDTAYKIALILAALVLAICIEYVVGEGKRLHAEYTEWSTQKRREKFRKPAYKQMNKRWTQHVNREALWRRLPK